MNITNKRKHYLKKLYYNAAKSINDDIQKYMKHYIDYRYLNSLIMSFSDGSSQSCFKVNDCCGAFFNTLCRKMISELYYNNMLIIVSDPYFSEDIACQLYITDTDISIINSFYASNICNGKPLYSEIAAEKSQKSCIIANEFLDKSYKIR